MDVFEKMAAAKAEIAEAVVNSAEELEQFRIRFLGSKNILKELFAAIKEVPNEQKKEFGQKVNELKTLAQERFDTLSAGFSSKGSEEKYTVDLTLPDRKSTRLNSSH